MGLVLLYIVITLGHIMLTPRFGFCEVIIITTFLHFSVDLVIMDFKPISSEIREAIIYNEGNSQKFIAEKAGTSRKGVQGVLKRWGGTGESKCQPQSGRKQESSKRADGTLVRLSLAERN